MPRLEADLAEDVNLEKEGGNTYPDGDGEGEEEEEDSLEPLSLSRYMDYYRFGGRTERRWNADGALDGRSERSI